MLRLVLWTEITGKKNRKIGMLRGKIKDLADFLIDKLLLWRSRLLP
jgi:hypothetical protein